MTDEVRRELEKMIEENVPTEISPGMVVKGVVVSKRSDGVLVDLRTKSEGFVPHNELLRPVERYREGEEIEVLVIRVPRGDEEEELIRASEKQPVIRKILDKIERAYHEGSPVLGRIVDRQKGGYVVEIDGVIKAFLPGSHSMLERSDRIPRKAMEFAIIDFRRQRRDQYNVVVSRKELEEREIRKFFESVQVGSVVEGIVEAVKDFGAFVKLTDKITALLPRSEINWETNPNPRDHFKRRQRVRAKVIDMDPEERKVTLSTKALIPDPWEGIEERYRVGERYSGTVKTIAPFGFFVELEPGIEGLVHISEVFWGNIKKDVSEAVSVGETVEVEVLEVNPEERKIALSYKRAKGDPWERIEEIYSEGSVHEGVVAKILPTGAIVELEDGVSGLVHLSELSWGYVEEPEEVVKVGDRVLVKVISLDKANRRMKLSLRQAQGNPWEELAQKLKRGSVVKAVVRRVINSGVIVELVEGNVEAFIPAAHASAELKRDLKELFKPGDVVEAVVMKLSTETELGRRNLILSIRELEIAKEKLEYKKMQEKEIEEAKITLGDLLKEKVTHGNGGDSR